MSAFNVLYRGEPDDAADLLDGDHPTEDVTDLRGALTNALRRVARLERALRALTEPLAGSPEHRAQDEPAPPQYSSTVGDGWSPPELRALPEETDEDGLPL